MLWYTTVTGLWPLGDICICMMIWHNKRFKLNWIDDVWKKTALTKIICKIPKVVNAYYYWYTYFSYIGFFILNQVLHNSNYIIFYLNSVPESCPLFLFLNKIILFSFYLNIGPIIIFGVSVIFMKRTFEYSSSLPSVTLSFW